MPQQPSQLAGLHDEWERRQRPRFRCCGNARVSALPANGAPVPGRIVNVSLGGCYVETGLVLRPGTLTELCLTVDGIPLRTVSLVRAVREHNGFGVEFTRLTRRGQDMLRELLGELARRNSLQTTIFPALQTAPQEYILQPQRPAPESPPTDGNLVVVETMIPAASAALEPVPAPDGATPGESSFHVPLNIVV